MGVTVAVAGYCRVCGQYVWLNDQWGCANGHAWNEISNWYDPATGTAVTPYWLQPQQPSATPAPAPMPQPVAPVAPVAPMPVAPTPVAPVAPAPVAPTPVAPQLAPEPVAVASAPTLEVAPQPVAAPVPEPEPAQAAAPAPEPVAFEPTPVPEPPAPAPAPEPAPVPEPPAPAPAAESAPASDRLTLLADILATLSASPGHAVQYGTDTDIVIGNAAIVASGAAYEARLKAVEPEHTVYFWESLPGQPGIPITWQLVSGVVQRHGWQLEAVADRAAATW